MNFELFPEIDTKEKCQDLAQQYNKLDCLDDVSLKCFREAFIIAKMSGNNPVLITGDNGCGKTGYAQLMWGANQIRTKKSKTKEMLAANCAAFSENLIASELFGHTENAFTGAKKKRQGKIIAACDKGCLFLDEIGDLPYRPRQCSSAFSRIRKFNPWVLTNP